MKIFNPKDIKKVETAIHSEEATSRHIEYEIPFEYALKLDNKTIVNMQIKQLTYEEYQKYYAYHSYLTKILSNIEKTKIDVKEIEQLHTLCFYLTRLSTCLNPESIVTKDIVSIYNAKYKETIKKKHYKTLFYSIINTLKYFNIAELEDYKKYINNNNFQLRFNFNFKEYKTLKNSSLDYLKNLSKIIIDYNVAKILSKTKFHETIDIFNQVLLYNTYIKKNLSETQKAILSRMEGTGKQTRTLGNSSTITIGENYLTLE